MTTNQQGVQAGGYGGAMQVFDGPGVIVSNSTFTNNKAVYGGAIYAGANTALFVRSSSVFSGNSAVIEGGAIDNAGSVTLFDNVTLTGNSLAAGGLGAAITNSGTADLTDVTISGNTIPAGAQSFGGGIFNSGTATLRNVTLSGNSVSDAQGFGGGIYNHFSGSNISLTMAGRSSALMYHPLTILRPVLSHFIPTQVTSIPQAAAEHSIRTQPGRPIPPVVIPRLSIMTLARTSPPMAPSPCSITQPVCPTPLVVTAPSTTTRLDRITSQ
jgi:predicted outer membrane repeat protein